jgi:hypothetical protein
MVDVLVEMFEAGRLELDNEGRRITDSQIARDMLSDRLEKALTNLTRSALLVS